ncbi:hypothetical protein [Melaminivora sp.]|uniref:hypothetical protein n=1 Tax=Melaminivora sp. TaxID=1933032 RepID=UPI0028B06BF5|nr:hypothetical protein [Melaminivora sp.]
MIDVAGSPADERLGELAQLLLDFGRAPGRYAVRRGEPQALHAQIDTLAQWALARLPQELADALDAPQRAELVQAAVLFLQRCCFAPDSTHYQVLGFTPEMFAPALLRQRYRALIRLTHPDMGVAGLPANAAGMVNRAHEVLGSAPLREQYDEQLARQASAAAAAAQASAAAAAAQTQRAGPAPGPAGAPPWPAAGVRRPVPLARVAAPRGLGERWASLAAQYPGLVKVALLFGTVALVAAALMAWMASESSASRSGMLVAARPAEGEQPAQAAAREAPGNVGRGDAAPAGVATNVAANATANARPAGAETPRSAPTPGTPPVPAAPSVPAALATPALSAPAMPTAPAAPRERVAGAQALAAVQAAPVATPAVATATPAGAAPPSLPPAAAAQAPAVAAPAPAAPTAAAQAASLHNTPVPAVAAAPRPALATPAMAMAQEAGASAVTAPGPAAAPPAVPLAPAAPAWSVDAAAARQYLEDIIGTMRQPAETRRMHTYLSGMKVKGTLLHPVVALHARMQDVQVQRTGWSENAQPGALLVRALLVFQPRQGDGSAEVYRLTAEFQGSREGTLLERLDLRPEL